MKHRVEYGKLEDINKLKVGEEETEIEGIKNYRLKEIYLPVLDRKYIDKFNPLKTCISLCGNNKFELEDENKFIKEVIKSVEDLKWYHLNSMYGQNESIGEFNLFEKLDIPNGYMLNSYTVEKDAEEYYLILWITPKYYEQNYRKHLYWYEKNHNGDWY